MSLGKSVKEIKCSGKENSERKEWTEIIMYIVYEG